MVATNLRLVVLLALVTLTGAPNAATGTKRAVIIAGSNEYYNYRHQADVSHAYQVLHKLGGFPPENIITMMFDDIARNDQNPFQNNIINHPNGTNVYPEAASIDYSGDQVTAKTFLSVLDGTAKGKSLKGSTSNDDVFIYFSDHGAQGLIAMPTGDPLYADQLKKTLHKMFQAKSYRQMVIYIEACESGSMFEGLLPTHWNIYATTASDGEHSSYACYWDDKRQVYLGDVYSVNWLEDTDSNEMDGETLEEQWKHVAAKTNTSTVLQFGDLSIAEEPDTEFLEFGSKFIHYKRGLKNTASADYTGPTVSSRDVELSTLQMRLKKATDGDVMEELRHLISKEIRTRDTWDLYFDTISKAALEDQIVPLSKRQHELDWILRGRTPPRNFRCLRVAYSATEQCLGPFTDYGLQFVRSLVNLCETITMTEMNKLLGKTCHSVKQVTHSPGNM